MQPQKRPSLLHVIANHCPCNRRSPSVFCMSLRGAGQPRGPRKAALCGERRCKEAGAVFAARRKRNQADFAPTMRRGNPHPRRETWQAGTTSGKSAATFVFAQSTTLRYALPQGYGLSRRFAPGNDMQNLLRVSVCKHTSTFLQTPCVCLSWRRRSGCGTDRRTGRLSAAAGRGCPPPGCGRRQ